MFMALSLPWHTNFRSSRELAVPVAETILTWRVQKLALEEDWSWNFGSHLENLLVLSSYPEDGDVRPGVRRGSGLFDYSEMESSPLS